MIKWAEISVEASRVRLDLLSQFWRDNGIENELQYLEVSPSKFEAELHRAMEEFDAIRVGRGLGGAVYGQFNRHSVTIRGLKSADAIVKIDGQWWLRSATLAGVLKVLSEIGEEIDLESSALVVGTGAGARAVINALITIGIKKFNITNEDDEQAKILIGEIQRSFFGVKFTLVPQERLISLPGENGVVVNTTPSLESNEVLDELNYLNFLRRPGIVIDLSFDPPETALLHEAKGVGAKIVKGYEISSWADIEWSEWVLGQRLDRQKLLEIYQSALES